MASTSSSNTHPTMNRKGVRRRRKLGLTCASAHMATAPISARITPLRTCSRFWPEALYWTTRPNSVISPSPTSSGPSSFKAPSMRPANEKVRWLREPTSMGSYMAASFLSRRCRRGSGGARHGRRDLGCGGVAQNVLVEHPPRDDRGRGAVFAILDQHGHRDLGGLGRREGDEPAVIVQALVEFLLVVLLVLRDREHLRGAGLAGDLELRARLAA